MKPAYPSIQSPVLSSRRTSGPRLAALTCLLLGLQVAAFAQAPGATAAPAAPASAPAYTPPAFVQGHLLHWYIPKAQAFVQADLSLQQALQQHCTGGAPKSLAQQRWREALLAWNQLAAVAIGPVVQRRSVRRIDFSPVRPELIQRAITSVAQATDRDAALERVGSAARGFGALEWLLWTRPGAKLDADACGYAGVLAAELLDEGKAVAAAFEAQAKEIDGAKADDAKVLDAMSEAINQWVGGVEQLRLQGIERPLHDAESRDLAKPVLNRDASGASSAERQARWSALRALAIYEGKGSPVAGSAVVPLESYLRSTDQVPLAERLKISVTAADRALNDARNDNLARLKTAARRLAELAALVQGVVAPAMDVRMGFSDADGD